MSDRGVVSDIPCLFSFGANMYKNITKEFLRTHTRKEIVEITGATVQTVTNWCIKYKVEPLKRTKYGEGLAEHAGKMTDRNVSKILGCSSVTVRKYRLKHNIPKYHKPYSGKYTLEYLRELHDTYGSWEKAGQALGVSKQMLSASAVRLGMYVGYESRFTKSEIIELLKEYSTLAEASRRINVKYRTLYNWYRVYFNVPPNKVR